MRLRTVAGFYEDGGRVARMSITATNYAHRLAVGARHDAYQVWVVRPQSHS